jgi:hypothetical protein
MSPDWALAAALLGGTRTMREAGEAYLPRWPAETAEAYKARLSVSVLFPAYARTATTLASKPFSKAVAIADEVPSDVLALLQDVDLQGRNVDRFAADVMETVTGYGLAGILVDFPDAKDVPSTAAGVRTQAAERAAGLRPYWVHIMPGQILGWRAAMIDGSWRLQMLRLKESVEEPDGEFGMAAVEQERVLEPGRWRVYRETVTTAGKGWTLHDEGTTTLDFVPFVPCYGKRTGFMTAEPPLLEVAHLNAAHWQSASDQQNILHVARVPILVAKNVQDPVNGAGEVQPWELKIGAGAAVRISGQDCGLEYVEHSGQALSAGAADLKELEARMRQAGAELLVIGDGQKTRIEAAGDNELASCALQRMVIAFEDALDQAIYYTARWLGQDAPQTGSVDLFKDFGASSLGEASGQLLLDANMAGKLSDETLHTEFKRRGVISADSTWEDESERLQGQGPSLGGMVDESPATGPTSATTSPATLESTPLDLSPIVAAIDAGMQALAAAQPAPMDLAALLAAIQPQPAAPISITAPAPDMTAIAAAMQTFSAALGAMQPAQVNVSAPDNSGNVALIESVASSVAAVAAAADALQKVAQELPAAVAKAAPKTVSAEVLMPKRTATATFTTDADGNITGASLTDQ